MIDDISDLMNLSYITWSEMTLRIGLALAFGFLLGLDRQNKSKPIDFRAYMIVAVISCVIAILSQELYNEFSLKPEGASIDLAKVIAGTLAGIGFLGAGAIMQVDKNHLVGTATGASIWASGGIGLTLGYGYYGLAFMAFISIAFILVIGGFLRGENKKD